MWTLLSRLALRKISTDIDNNLIFLTLKNCGNFRPKILKSKSCQESEGTKMKCHYWRTTNLLKRKIEVFTKRYIPHIALIIVNPIILKILLPHFIINIILIIIINEDVKSV